MKKQKLIFYMSFAYGVLAPSLSHAAGFAIIEQNVSGLGNAYAGASSIAEDASTVFFNPAGMTQLSGKQFSAGLHAITPSAKFSNVNSTVTTGGNGGDAGGTEIVPNIYFVTPISKRTQFGIGINAPFGLTTDYDAGWKGRYHAVKSSVSTININPSIGFSTDSPFSFGVGMNIQYLDAELTNAIDFGSACVGLENAGKLAPGTCGPLGVNLVPQDPNSDGFSKIEGDSWALGYNFGILFAPGKESRVGLSYRSMMKHTLGGSADFTVPTRANAIFGIPFADTDATADITLPESWALSSYRALNKHWEFLGEITFTKWSQFQELVIKFDNPYKSDSVEEVKFRNTYRYAIGANYKPNKHFVYRLGFAFDEGAAPNATYRTPRIPDQDRTWLALGFGYRQKTVSFDVGYAHLFMDDAPITRTSATGDKLRGNYQLSIDILSAQFNYAF